MARNGRILFQGETNVVRDIPWTTHGMILYCFSHGLSRMYTDIPRKHCKFHNFQKSFVTFRGRPCDDSILFSHGLSRISTDILRKHCKFHNFQKSSVTFRGRPCDDSKVLRAIRNRPCENLTPCHPWTSAWRFYIVFTRIITDIQRYSKETLLAP